MTTQLESKIYQILGGREFSDLSSDEWVNIGKIVKSGEMKGLAKLKGVSPSDYADKPGLLIEPTSELVRVFNRASGADLLIALQFCEASTSSSVITPFNVVDILTSLKYNYSQVTSFKDTNVVRKVEKMNGSERITIDFPLTSRGLVFTKGTTVIGVPLEFDGVFNTRFITGLDLVVCPFSPIKARLARTFCTLFSYIGGKCKPVANNTVNKNLVAGTIVKGNVAVLTAICLKMTELVNSTGICTSDTLNGIEWLSAMYRVLISTQGTDPKFNMIAALMNKYMAGCDQKGNLCDFMIIKNGLIMVNYPKWAFPKSLDGVVLNAKNGEVTLRQAYYALELCRGVRLADLRERGAIPRTAYLEVPIAPIMADIVHLASQLAGLVPSDADVFITSVEDNPTQFIRAVESLIINDHKGKITVASSGIIGMLKRNGFGWTFKGREIVVVGFNDILKHIVPKGSKDKKPSLVIDMTSREPQFTSKSLISFYDSVKQSTTERVEFYNRFGIEFALRSSLYEQICELDVKSIKMSSSGHNLVVWVSSLAENHSLGIDIKSEKDVGKACTWSFMCNIARLLAPLTGVGVPQVLNAVGNNFSFEVPKISFKLPDNYVIHADAEFELLDINSIRNMTVDEYDDLVNSSSPAVQAYLAENREIRDNESTSTTTSTTTIEGDYIDPNYSNEQF